MRIVFAGTPKFAVESLSVLHSADHEIVAVYCQPDRPKGRGKILGSCAVKQYAEDNNLLVIQPENFNDNQNQLAMLEPDIMVVVAYGQILPESVLTIPKYGCLNIHASLLPRWRGAAPIERAILEGDSVTGIAIIQMSKDLDTGDILLEKKYKISPTDTAQMLHDKLAGVGAHALIEVLDNIHTIEPKPQNKEGITYAQKLTKNEAWIDWSKSAVEINQKIRAFNLYPVAQTNATSDKFTNKVLRILSAKVVNEITSKSPGHVTTRTKDKCQIATGNGLLQLERVQLAGKRAIDIKDFANAYRLNKLE